MRFETEQLGVDVCSRPLTLAYHGRFDGTASAAAVGLQYARNLGGGSDNNEGAYVANRVGAGRRWEAWRYNLDGARRIAPVTLNLRMRGQFANEPLVPGEQFGFGGATSVRGLREREVSGDYGYTIALEAVAPLPWEDFSALVFFDRGVARRKNSQPGEWGTRRPPAWDWAYAG